MKRSKVYFGIYQERLWDNRNVINKMYLSGRFFTWPGHSLVTTYVGHIITASE